MVGCGTRDALRVAVALKTWLWNLGAAGTVVAAAGCGPAVALPGDTDGDADTEGTDTVILPTTPVSETDYNDSYSDSYHDSYYDSYNDSDNYNYDTDYYGYDTDDYGDPECFGDEDCELGECVDPGEPGSYCDVLPIPQPCATDVQLELAWVRQGEGAGTAAGVVGRGEEPRRVLLLGTDIEGEPAAVAVAGVETDAPALALPIVLAKTEQITGLEQADLDGDGGLDLLVSVRDDAGMRVVPLLERVDAPFEVAPAVVFEGPGGPARLRRLADGGLQILARLDSGLLFEASSLGDGTFSAPTSSGWATDPIAGFAVGPLDLAASDDVLAAVLGPEEGQSSLDALIDGGSLPVGVTGSASREVFIDAWLGHFVTIDTSPGDFTYVQAGMLGVNAPAEQVLVPQDVAPRMAVVTDVDGDGFSDLVSIHESGQVTVVFQVARAEACIQNLGIKGTFDTALAAGSGSERGVVLSGPSGVLSVSGG